VSGLKKLFKLSGEVTKKKINLNEYRDFRVPGKRGSDTTEEGKDGFRTQQNREKRLLMHLAAKGLIDNSSVFGTLKKKLKERAISGTDNIPRGTGPYPKRFKKNTF